MRGECTACGEWNKDCHIHHIVPLSKGGLDRAGNRIRVCENCHSLIHDQKLMGHTELVKSGIAAAKARGVRFGAKKGSKSNRDYRKEYPSSLIEAIDDLVKEGFSNRTIARVVCGPNIDESMSEYKVRYIRKRYSI